MPTVNLPPIVLETLALTNRASISTEQIERVAQSVNRAVAEANRAIDTALDRVHEAERRQLVINSHKTKHANACQAGADRPAGNRTAAAQPHTVGTPKSDRTA